MIRVFLTSRHVHPIMNLPANSIILGNCLVEMDSIPDASIDLVVTDPPYGAGFDFANDKLPLPELLEFTGRWVQKVAAKLKPTGSLYCFIDGEHLGHFQTIIGKHLVFRKIVVWYFEAFFNGFHGNYDNRSEFILFYTKSGGYTFTMMKEPPSASMIKRWGPYADKDGNIPYEVLTPSMRARQSKENYDRNPTNINRGAYQGNVIQLKRARFREHPTQKPEPLIEKLLAISSNEGDVVLDPFAGCYDDQTEIMTEKRGFVKFEHLLPGDKVASLVDDRLDFVTPLRHFKYRYDGEMYIVKGRSVDLLVTPNHNLYCKEFHQDGFQLVPVSGVKWKTIHFKSTCDWNGEYREWFSLPESPRLTNKDHFTTDPAMQIKMDDWIEFLGYYISEGSTTKSRQQFGFSYVVQIRQNEGIKKDKIRNCLIRLPFHFTESDGKFRIFDKQLYDYLSQFGKSKDKHVPFEFKRLCKEQLTILFNALMLGDGHTRSNGAMAYYTVSSALRDDVCEIMVKIGYSPTVNGKICKGNIVVKNGMFRLISSSNMQYTIYAKMNEKLKLHPDENFTTGQYDGLVYCVEVPSHVIYVRRNGKCCWCGNSGTTCAVAKKMRRKYIGIEIDPDFHATATRRVDGIVVTKRIDDFV
jgi:DNA modification methylase